MASPKASIGNAQAGEERYRMSIREAVLEHLGKTPEGVAWCEAALESLWEYGERSPFQVAADAWHSGNRELHKKARTDDARLAALAKAAADAAE